MNLGENATELVYEAISLDAGTRAYLYAESLDKYTPGSFHHTQPAEITQIGMNGIVRRRWINFLLALTDLIELALDVELGVLGLGVLQLDRHLVAGGDVRRDVDVSEAATSDLATEAVSSRDPNVQFTCYTSLSICSLSFEGYTVEFLGRW